MERNTQWLVEGKPVWCFGLGKTWVNVRKNFQCGGWYSQGKDIRKMRRKWAVGALLNSDHSQ